MAKKWVIADGEKDNATFFYGKNLWGKDRFKAILYSDKREAEAVALKLDSNCIEVETETLSMPFRVPEWGYHLCTVDHSYSGTTRHDK